MLSFKAFRLTDLNTIAKIEMLNCSLYNATFIEALGSLKYYPCSY